MQNAKPHRGDIIIYKHKIMLQSLIIGIGGIIFLMIVWFAIQTWWGKTFPDHVIDDDAMAGRTKCSNCDCTAECENKNQELTSEGIHQTQE